MPTNKNINRAGYLRESFHYFHLRDTAGQELDFHFHEFDNLVILLTFSSSSARMGPFIKPSLTAVSPTNASSSISTGGILSAPSPARDSWTASTRPIGGGVIC